MDVDVSRIAAPTAMITCRMAIPVRASAQPVCPDSSCPCLQVIQLQGDQRKNVLQFLTEEGLVKKDLIKIHGF